MDKEALIQTLKNDITYIHRVEFLEHQKGVASPQQVLLLSQLQIQDINILITHSIRGPSYSYYLNLQAPNH